MADVPEGRCGFTLEYEDLPVDSEINLDDFEMWYERNGAVCWRESWDEVDSGRCIWHAEVDGKPVEELVENVCEQDERIDGAILRKVKAGDTLSFCGMWLVGADFTDSALRETNLSNSILGHANLYGTDLRSVDFSDADLRSANLSDAYLQDAVLLNADLRNTNLSAANLWDADLSGACLRDADLSDACLWDADLSDADFGRTDFFDAGHGDTDVPRGSANFSGADLFCADFTEAALGGVNLSSVDLRGADLLDADLRDASLLDADLRGADLSGAIFWGADLSNSTLLNVDLSSANLGRANLVGAVLQNADLSGADLGDGDLSGAALEGADLSDSTLGGANLYSTSLGGADLSCAILQGANLSGADLGRGDLSGAALGGAVLSGAVLQAADFSGTHFEDADLTSANLAEATLTDANLQRANLTRTNLFDADLRGANFYGAILTDVQLDANTEFGGHYTNDEGDFNPDHSAWMFRQLQRLFRENAFPKQARQAYLAHKDIRRKEQWAKAPIPGAIRDAVWRTKVGYWKRKRAAKSFVRGLLETENETEDDDEQNEKPAGNDGADPTEPWLEEPSDLEADSRPDSWLNLLGWARAATSGAIMRYGESPWRVVGVSLLTVVGFGLIYPFVGGMEQTQAETTPFAFAEMFPLPVGSGTVEILFQNMYFSAVTFTTLGYGDIQPASQTAKLLASVESLLGALLMALLVFVLGRRTTW